MNLNRLPPLDRRQFLRAALVAGGTALTSAAGCSTNAPAPTEPTSPKPPRWNDAWAMRVNSGALLAALGPDAKAADPAAQELWRGLFKAVADDAGSQQLLKKLYGGLPVEFVVLDGTAAFDEDKAKEARPKAATSAVLLTVHARQPGEWSKAENQLYGRLSFSRVVRLAEGDPSIPTSVDAALANQHEELEVFYLVVNDYLVRKAPGWQFVFQNGPSARPEYTTQPQADAKQLRDALDRRAAEYVKARK